MAFMEPNSGNWREREAELRKRWLRWPGERKTAQKDREGRGERRTFPTLSPAQESRVVVGRGGLRTAPLHSLPRTKKAEA